MSGQARSEPLDETMSPSQTLGGLQENPDDEIGALAGLVALSGGRLVLVEETRVRVFERSGVETWRHGQPGAGPQDFRLLSAPCHFHGDTLVAMDVGNARLAYIVAGEGVIATVPVERARMRDGACSGRGAFLVTRHLRDSIGSSPSLEVWLHGGPTAQPRLIHQAGELGPETVGAGSVTVGFSDSLVFVGDPNRGEILMLNQAGQFHRLLRWDAPRTPITDANIPEMYGRAPRNATPEQLAAFWTEVRAQPRAPMWPAFRDVAAASRGRLWVWPATQVGQDSVTTVVVSGAGEMLGRVTLPLPTSERLLYILALLPDGVALMHTDANGAARISVVPYPKALR